MDRVIITCAITGSRITREQTPYIPVEPEEIIDSAVAASEAGAAIVHIHVRDPKTKLGTQEIELFRQVSDGIKARCNAIQCLTTSGIPGRNLSENERMEPLTLRPELASVDCGFQDRAESMERPFPIGPRPEMRPKSVHRRRIGYRIGIVRC